METPAEIAAELPPHEAPTAVITVRMVPSLHQRIRETAQRERISINGLCLKAIELALRRYDSLQQCRDEKATIEEELAAEAEKTRDHLQAEPSAV